MLLLLCEHGLVARIPWVADCHQTMICGDCCIGVPLAVKRVTSKALGTKWALESEVRPTT
ncbi:hypothetical protein DPMN_003436 [Dreissena polymorpha]|uniref:Uncharacterized protein n=1 Tax=Dreissena polymorpha TaxID=45954 RepID=A0A9D4MN82_DREPO|nr:hypothetical protein DPMN_003436 [Dreissena polymorpha]